VLVSEEKFPGAVIVIAQNEEVNLEACLLSAGGWAPQVFVVDGGSTDQTMEIARRCGAHVYQHPFTHWADQRNWALQNLPLEGTWVFFLDADEQLTDAFKHALHQVLSKIPDEITGIYVCFDLYFMNRLLSHAPEPPHLRIVRRGQASWIAQGAREYCRLQGKTMVVHEALIHWDRRGLHYWIEKQNRNASREARQILNGQHLNAASQPGVSLERPLRTWMRTRLYPRLPGWLKPFLHFTYRYFVKRGFLDGYPGFVFSFLHAFWLPLLVEAKVYESRRGKESMDS
jgi:glycosyltransferase involved in cell wall biosynthesis